MPRIFCQSFLGKSYKQKNCFEINCLQTVDGRAIRLKRNGSEMGTEGKRNGNGMERRFKFTYAQVRLRESVLTLAKRNGIERNAARPQLHYYNIIKFKTNRCYRKK